MQLLRIYCGTSSEILQDLCQRKNKIPLFIRRHSRGFCQMSCVPIKLETEVEFTRQDENRLNHVCFCSSQRKKNIYQRTTCAKTIINLQQRLCHRVFKFFKRIFFPIEANPRSTSKRPLTTQNYADWRNRKNLDSSHLCLVNSLFFYVEYCLAI